MSHPSGFLNLVDEIKPEIKELNITQAKAKLETDANSILIDVREDHEWQIKRISSAIHLGRGIIERDIEKIYPKDKTLILYCGGGFRSALSTYNLQKMGYTNVYSMDGGIKAWEEAGFSMNFSRA